MARVIRFIGSRWVTTFILALFTALYIVLALSTTEPILALMTLVRTQPLVNLALWIIPLNQAVHLFLQFYHSYCRRKILHSGSPLQSPAALGEGYQLLEVTADPVIVGEWLSARGFRTKSFTFGLRATRGTSYQAAAVLLRLGTALLIAGISLSLVGRQVQRTVLVEGEPVPPELGINGTVQAINLREVPQGILLSRDLSITIRDQDHGTPLPDLRLFPCTRVNGIYFYPRYLGVAPQINISAQNGGVISSDYHLLMIYPPGKEDTASVPDTPLRITMGLLASDNGDPYITGQFKFNVRLNDEKEQLASSMMSMGETTTAGGYQLEIPRAARFVAFDCVKDPGLSLVWVGLCSFLLGNFGLLLITGMRRREELLIIQKDEKVILAFINEGRRQYPGILPQLLDCLEASQDTKLPLPEHKIMDKI